MRYVTLEEFRAAASLGDLAIDTEMTRAIEAAEESIEDYCFRRFWQDSADVKRYYAGDTGSFVLTDDLVSVTTLKTDFTGDGTFETTWAASDYVLFPYNAAADGRPYTRIETTAVGVNRFPAWPRSVEVDGKFGWPSVPTRVQEATVLQATQLLKRARSAPFGIETVGVDGVAVRIRAKLDPQVEVMLSSLRRFRP